MNLLKLPLPANIIDALSRGGISELNPPQIAAVKPLFAGKNLVVSAPTASGKTLIAELAMLRAFLANKKTLYLVPLKALASEKYEEFKKKYEALGMRIAISTGDMDSTSDYLDRYDLVIASNEKADSLLRHEAKWLRDAHLVIADEIHVLNDVSRGPTLEVVLTRLSEYAKQIVALSATIQNASEIAEWLGAELIESDYRPIKLYRGVCYPDNDAGKGSSNDYGGSDNGVNRNAGKLNISANAGSRHIDSRSRGGAGERSIIDFIEKQKYVSGTGEAALCKDCIALGKQALVFVSTRRSAEAAAENIAKHIATSLKAEERKRLRALSNAVLNALPHPTKQCRRLAKILEGGAAFHHAGLVAKQRKLIEDEFRNGLIKVIAATPTLALGINMPAYRVVIRDVRRYGEYGSSFLPVLEVAQMLGRAGRPKYDTEGEAVILAKSEHDAEEAKDRYILGEMEPIYSKLSMESILRMHTLALIASGIESMEKLASFFNRTFFAYQYGDACEVMEKVERILKQLVQWRFVDVSKNSFISSEFVPAFDISKSVALRATPIGKRVAQLYIDPLSAHNILADMKTKSDSAHIVTLCRCAEMWPLLRPRKSDAVEEKIPDDVEVPNVWDIEYESFLAAVKTAAMLMEWAEERGEDMLLEEYGIAPGELYNKKRSAEWLLYAAKELALLSERKDIANDYNRLQLRVKHGVRKELLPLVRVRGIGRVRARLLHKNNVRNAKDIRAKGRLVEELLGKKVAAGVLKDISTRTKPIQETNKGEESV